MAQLLALEDFLTQKKSAGGIRPDQLQFLTGGGAAQQPTGEPMPDGVPGRTPNDMAPEMPVPQELQQIPSQSNFESPETIDNYDQIRQMQAENQKRLQPYLDKQEAGLGDMERMVAQYKATPKEMDISPLAALVDTMTGSKLAQTITKPKESNLDKAQNIAALTDLLQKERGALTAAQAKALSDIGIRGLEGAKRDERAKTSRELKSNSGLFSAFNGDLEVKKIKEGNLAAQEALQILSSGSKIGDSGVKIKIARALGAAPISDTDLALLAGDPSIVARMDRLRVRLSEGTLTEADRADATLLINKMAEFSNDAYKKKIDYYSDKVAPGVFSVSPDKARGFLSQDLVATPKKQQASGYSEKDEAGISKVMQHNKIDRSAAIKALKDAGKLK